jgi:hypothetical protein
MSILESFASARPRDEMERAFPDDEHDDLLQIKGNDRLIYRRHEAPNLKIAVREQEIFTRLALDLQDRYAIETPGISVMMVDKGPVAGNQPYVGAGRLEGVTFSRDGFPSAYKKDEPPHIPPETIRQAYQAMLDYYADVVTGDGDYYLTDLRPQNLMYGRLQPDEAEKLYFIDVDPQTIARSYDQVPHKLNEMALAAVKDIGWFLDHSASRYGQDFDDLKMMQAAILASQRPADSETTAVSEQLAA